MLKWVNRRLRFSENAFFYSFLVFSFFLDSMPLLTARTAQWNLQRTARTSPGALGWAVSFCSNRGHRFFFASGGSAKGSNGSIGGCVFLKMHFLHFFFFFFFFDALADRTDCPVEPSAYSAHF